ncbi:MAG: helix-turn-helix domain-containing protein [Leptotrichia hongkongensis]
MSKIKFKLHILMAEHRMNQKELSQKTGIHPPTINKYFHDTIQKIDREHLAKFCEIFNCQISDIMEYVPD